jgi:hypothetical protein
MGGEDLSIRQIPVVNVLFCGPTRYDVRIEDSSRLFFMVGVSPASYARNAAANFAG